MTEFLRRPGHYYEDPLARVWIACAERIGFRIGRSPDVYASTDGRGTIYIGTDETLDPDDSLAQIILHELCHALVEGEAGEGRVDWGLDNTGDPHTWHKRAWREHACLRLQAYLADRVGLRGFFAPTTDFRVSFWDALPADPFAAPMEAGGRRERSCVAARLAAWRASQPRWAPYLQEALTASAMIAAVVPRLTCGDATDASGETASGCAGEGRSAQRMLPSLWTTAAEPPAPHPAGHAPVAAYPAARGCADCAWAFAERRRRRCRHAPGIRLPDDVPACVRFEPAEELDCLTCGACCREAYHSVEISGGEPVNRRHPNLIVIRAAHRGLLRDGERCAALCGGHTPAEPYACTIYPDRPRTCREFTRGSANCLDARRRVGLSL